MVIVQRPTDQGLSLVELMVTMIIASIVAASTFMFFAGQQRVYETQTKLLNVQQNAWASMEVISRFVRSEGSGMYGCVRPVGGLTPPPPPLNRTASDAVVTSDDPPIAVNPVIRNLSRAPNAGMRAHVGGAMQRIPPLWIVDQEDGTDAGIVPGTDVITVAFGNRASGTNFDSLLAATVVSAIDPITTPATFAAMFQTGEFILLIGTPGMASVTSDIGCTLFQITAVGAVSNTLSCATDATAICIPGESTCTGSRWNPSGAIAGMIPAGGYVPSADTGIRNFGELWWVRFAIRSADPTNPLVIPTLTMERLDGATPTGPQVLAEGIEDLQVAFACDLNSDGVLTEDTTNKTADEWTLNDLNDPIPLTNAAKCNQPTAIRLTLIARSLTEDNGIDAVLTNNRRPAAENHEAGAPDQFRRRVMTTTIYPRNN